MKLLIAVDMEGITGVVDWSQVNSSHAEYGRARAMMTADVNAAIRGACQAGADEIIVSDGHGGKTNILIEALDPRARLNSGTGPLAMVQGVDQGVQAAFFIGYHARAGAQNAILAHTVSGAKIANLWLNDRLVGEIGMNAATCGSFGVPVLLVSGDQAACDEACAAIPGVSVAVTKRASGHWAAECLTAAETHTLIEAQARAAVRAFADGKGPRAVETSLPARYTVEFKTPNMADNAGLAPGAVRLDGVRVQIEGETAARAYQSFRTMMVLG